MAIFYSYDRLREGTLFFNWIKLDTDYSSKRIQDIVGSCGAGTVRLNEVNMINFVDHLAPHF